MRKLRKAEIIIEENYTQESLSKIKEEAMQAFEESSFIKISSAEIKSCDIALIQLILAIKNAAKQHSKVTTFNIPFSAEAMDTINKCGFSDILGNLKTSA